MTDYAFPLLLLFSIPIASLLFWMAIGIYRKWKRQNLDPMSLPIFPIVSDSAGVARIQYVPVPWIVVVVGWGIAWAVVSAFVCGFSPVAIRAALGWLLLMLYLIFIASYQAWLQSRIRSGIYDIKVKENGTLLSLSPIFGRDHRIEVDSSNVHNLCVYFYGGGGTNGSIQWCVSVLFSQGDRKVEEKIALGSHLEMQVLANRIRSILRFK